jgi:hypothetical protein
MNQVLSFAFVPLFISVAVRWYLARAAGVDVLDVRTFSEFEIEVYLICLTLACVSFWHHFVRPTCPLASCKSYGVRHLGTEELNQYHTVRKVQERDNHGRLVTRHLNVTVAEMRKHFDCRDCGHKWFVDFKQDKK